LTSFAHSCVHVRHRNGILLTYISLTVRPY
jgi:hypothetical protein